MIIGQDVYVFLYRQPFIDDSRIGFGFQAVICVFLRALVDMRKVSVMM